MNHKHEQPDLRVKCPLEEESYESGRVVVLDGLGVAEGFEDGIGLQQLLLQLTLRSKTHQSTTEISSNEARRPADRVEELLKESLGIKTCMV